MFVILKTPTNLAIAKQEARNWEEIETNRVHRHESREKVITSLASPRTGMIDSFHVEKPNEERKERENTERHDLMQEKVDALQKQLEEERVSHDTQAKELLEKVSYLEMQKDRVKLMQEKVNVLQSQLDEERVSHDTLVKDL